MKALDIQRLASVINGFLNPSEEANDTGFIIMTFTFGEKIRMNYASNADRRDVLVALKEFTAKLEEHGPPETIQ